MRKLIIALVLTTAVCLTSAAVAFADVGPPPTQAAIQSASTSQAAGAASSAVQSQPTNTNISVRILSPGNDGSVSQSNDANSSANAGNSASTSQSATQSQPGSGVQSAVQSAGTDQLAAALSEAKQYGASNLNVPVRILSPGDGGSVTQSNTVGSTANAGNDARTRQTSTQSQGSSCGCSGAPGVQSGTQTADTNQGALAASKAVQIDPSNTNISVRILSPGNDGDVTQSNSVTSDANAGNRASTEQRVSQGKAGESCGCEAAATTPAATQPDAATQPAAVTQPDAATQSDATASQPVSTAGQTDSAVAPSSSPSIGVQAAGQDASTHQAAIAGSSAEQSGASNANYPVRIGSPGDGGSVDQSNAVTSEANAGNSAWTGQSANQTSGGKSCGCNSGIGIQAAAQKAETDQGSLALSKAIQQFGCGCRETSRCGCGDTPRCGCGWDGGSGNTSSPVRIWSPGTDGSLTQSNTADSSANAGNRAGTRQDATQQAGSGGGLQIQGLGQEAGTGQGSLAGSLAGQGGASNDAAPARVGSPGGGGSVDQSNDATSAARSGNDGWTSQTGNQVIGSSPCGCLRLPIQAIGQRAELDQLGLADSAAFQLFPKNDSSPVRIGSYGDGGSVGQENNDGSQADGGNRGRTNQSASQLT